MAKRVYELAKELEVQSKDLIAKISGLGIDVKNHMSTLTDEDIKKIKNNLKKDQVKAKESKPEPAPFIPANPGAPRPPIGKPIVDNEYLERKEKKKAGTMDGEKTSQKKVPEKTDQNKSVEKTDSKDRIKKEDVEIKPEVKEEKKEEKKAEKAKEARHQKTSEIKKEKKSKQEDNVKGKADEKSSQHAFEAKEKSMEKTTKKHEPEINMDQEEHKHSKKKKNNKNSRNHEDRMEERDKKSSSKNDRKKKKDKKKDNNQKQERPERRNLEKKQLKKYHKPKPADKEESSIEDELPEGTVVINVPITVAGFCEQTEVSPSQVIMTLMKLGVMANINQNIDEDTVLLLAEEMNLMVAIGNVEGSEDEVEEGIENFEDKEEDLVARPPIITVMGHVDHGKTSLLDAIRRTNVTSSESGGITQHIGASEVKINGKKIVFLDTPGHEAFTAMRARGAHVTDIAVLVVAADDSVKPQTVESISHAKAAGVPIIVAVNKMDKPAANPDRVKQDLAEHGILVEEWGGDVICVPVSAKKHQGIEELLEMILLQAEMMELKANPNRMAMGSVIEARLDKSKGAVATLLVTNGTLESGQSVVAGTSSGRIRLMTDFRGKKIRKAGPATAVEILGLTDVPQAGDEFNAVKEDKVARDIAEKRKEKLREEVLAKNASTTLEQLFSQIKEGEVKELNLIIKGDVQGSVGALVASLEKLNSDEVKVNIIHTGVGTVTESDVMLAGTSGSIIIAFNVRPTTAVQTMADREQIQIRTYRVIYDVIDDVENAMKGLLDPEFKEEILGKVEIRNTFKVPDVGIVGGAYVTEGKVQRNAEVRLVRDGIVIHEGKISSLKRFKDDAKEVAQGYECGIGIEDYNDIKEGDVIECFHMVEIERK